MTKITDLQLISSITDGLNFPNDNGIQSYRATALQLKNYVLETVMEKLCPVGSITKMAVPQAPTGFLKCNGAAVSRTTYSNLFQKLITDQAFSAQTFTVTIGAAAIVTKTAHGFLGGERLRFSTTGALPTGLSTLVDYFVVYIDANTFNLQTFADVLAATTVTTSGSQSGTHSYIQSLWGVGDGSTTFNIPDLRGVHDRAWDDARGLDPSRVMATFQMDAFKSHTHVQNSHNHIQDQHLHNITATGAGGGTSNLYQNGQASGTFNNSTQYATATNQAATATNQNTGGTETRPMNYALMPVIKY